ncbi:MAG: hypothetical protein HOE11_00645, partial [Candidatus Diapherotrites archaeon]|nr:hypothetical protein [Candidatus Diapherotrites archaeon]
MGVGEKLRDIYFSMEEKWYSMLDKIDAHIPIYKVVDKIDNVVPSFALLLIIILILVLLAGVSAFGVIGGGQEATLQLSVVDALGNGVDGATITLQGIDQTYYSNAFGLVDEINVPLGYTVSVTAEKGEMKSVEPIKIDSVATDATIILPINNISFSGKTIQFVSSYGTLINDELSLTYSCSSGTAPANETIYDGTTNVSVPSDCGTLTLNITSTKYERATETINDSVTTITLTEIAPVVNGRAIVNLTYNDVAINENVRVSAYRTSNSYYPEDTVTSSNGTAVFDLPEGDYTFESKQELGYKSERSDPVSVSSLNDATTSIALTKDIVGKIMVSVAKDLRDADDVLVTLKKGSSQLDNDRTDTNGIVEFTLAEDGEFVVIATEDGYCSDSAAVEIGDTVQLNLVRDTGNCGGELAIKVIDQEGKPVQFARAMIFAETSEDSYKLGYTTKTTNLDGNAFWDPVSYSDTDEQYKVFAFKGAYSGWSNAKAFTTIDKEEFVVQLEVPWGNVNINVKDKDGDALQFAEVQLFEDYANTKVSGRRIIEENTGNINFAVKAGQRVYAVIEKEGYESYMTIPKSVIGDGTINFDVTLSRPPREELLIEPLGFYKNDSKALRVQPGEEYIAMFEITAPKLYDELGFFVRVGKDSVSKTEMDKIYIKELLVPGQNYQLKGSTYHPPKGTSIDDDALNLEESKWAQATWPANGFIKGKIRVGVKVRIKQNAQLEELLEIGYRAWGVENSAYERDPEDMVLGSTESNSQKHARYALTKPYYAWVGTEALCDEHGENSFCITATYTDPDGIKAGFDTSFDAQNNAKYVLGIKVLNASGVGFDSTKIKLENAQDNVLLGNYNLLKPNNLAISANINNYETEWIENGSMPKETEFTFSSLEVTPQKTGYGSLKLRLRDDSTILLEKTFGINIASDKTMKIEFMVDNEFSTALPVLVSGKMQTITLKARNSQNNLEINDASVKLYDRFSNKLYETTTNALGIASIEVPAALPGENLKISVEKPEYATSETEFSISENVVEVTPETLSFTVNPQTQVEDMKTVKIENQTGFDLEIKDIKLDGKLKGLLSESRIESWFNNYAGTTIAASDYEEINFKVFSAPVIPAADDLDAKFIITVGNEYNEWIREIDATIRVGLGNDVDDPACLSITKDSWIASTQGEEIEVSFEIKNECRVEGQSVTLQNLGARIDSTDNQIGKLSAQSLTAYTELSKAYARTFKTSITEDEIVPVTIKFTPYGGTTGETSGTIVFSASNPTDSTDQEITIGMDYTLNVLNSDCLVIGTDLLTIGEEETGTFSITNNCPVEASFRVESELQLNNTTFTLASGASKEVIINRMENDVAGAYNNLVFGRLGNDSFEVIGNVKAILSADGCFSLSRYEFDVYDSPYNDFDGMDSAYLRNNCVQRNVNATMTGNEEFDNDQIWRNALLGGLTGLFTSKGTLYGEKKLWGNEKEKKAGAYAEISYKTLQKQTRKYAAKVSNESADAMTAAGYRYDLFSGATKIGLMSKVRAEITERYTYNYNNCSGDPACETNAFNIASKEYNDANIVIDNYIRGNIDLAWKNMQTAQKALNSELINVVDALGGDAKDIKVQQQAQAALGRISTEDIENQTDEQAKKNLATLKTKLKAKAETFNKKMELFETAINNFQTKSAAGEIPVFATSVINTSKQAVLAQFNLAGSYYQSGATIPPANTTALLDMFYGKIATAPTSVTPPTVTPPTSPPVQPPASVTPQPTSPTPQTSVPQLTGRTTLRTRRIVDPATETNPPLVLINLPAPETAAPLVDNSTPPESTPEPVQLTPAIMDQRLNSKIGGLEIITKGLFKNMFNEEAANVNMLNIVNSETGNGREQTMVAESTDAESQVESILTIYSNGQADLKITGRQGDEERYIYATNDPVPSLSEPVVYGKPMEEIDRIIGLKENFLNEINGCISPFKATPIDEECKENNGEGEEYTEEELYEIYGTLIEPLKEHTKKAVATGAKGRQIAHFGSPSINKRSLYITGLYTDNTSFGTNIYYKGHYKFELHIDLRLFNSNKPAYEINNLTLEQLREVLAGEPKHDLEAFQSEIDNINTDTQKPTGTAEEKVTQAITRVKANGFCTQLGVCDGSGANVELIQTNGAEFFMVYGSPTANVSGTTGEKVGKASFAGDKSKITNLLYLQYEPEFDKVAKKLSKGFNTRAWVQENKLRISIEQDDADGSKKMHEYKYLSSMNSWELTSFRKTGSNSAIIDPVLNPESKLVYNYNDATQEFVRVGTREYADSIKQQLRDQVNNEGTASFLLAVPTNNTRNNRSSGGLGGGFLGGNSMSNILISGTAGMLGQSALGGSLWAGVATLLTAQDTEINRPYVFAVPLVTITDAVLTAEG